MLSNKKVLTGLPAGLRKPLLSSYNNIVSNYSESRWEPSELNGGKFCEVVYTIINGILSGKMASKPSKPRNMLEACRKLEQIKADSTIIGDRSLRVLIPRTICALYEIRNNRGVGHVGGDVDPNFLDATAVQSMASWILAELIRILHQIPIAEAQEVVDAVMERKHPMVWVVGDTKRVLNPKMNARDQALLLLHQSPGWVQVIDLFEWVEYSNLALFRKRLLIPLHKKRLIEYVPDDSRVRISPTGISEVEERILVN